MTKRLSNSSLPPLIFISLLIPALLYFANTPNAKLVLLAIFAIAYTLWGVIDHYISSPIFLKRVALEYLIISAIGLAPLAFLIYY